MSTNLQIVHRSDADRPAHLVRVVVPRLNKMDHIHEYLKQIEAHDYDLEWAEVTEVRNLNCAEWNDFVTGFLNDREWLEGKGGTSSWTGPNDDREFFQLSEDEREQWKRGAYIHVIACVAPTGQTIYIDPQGYSYARYVAFPAEGLAAPKSREEIREERAKAERDARLAELKRRIENPPAVPADHGLKFLWNGIKVNGTLHKTTYYLQESESNHYPVGTITIYCKDYGRFPPEAAKYFLIENNSDIQSDYFEKDKARVTPNHPLYAEVLKAHTAQEAHYAQVREKREQKYSRAM